MKLSAAELRAITRTLQLEQRRRAFRPLHAFTQGAWHIIEPGTPFKDNWHLQAIASHLEAVAAGHIKTLIINCPPRHAKSISTSVVLCPWEWGPKGAPHIRFLYSSYSGNLSIRDSLKARRIIQSDWYQELWPHVSLTGDQNAKIRFENTATGYRIATSVGGVGTGEGGDHIITDDAHSVQEAESDAVRESTVEWWSQVMSTRLNDPSTGSFVIIMQRVHENDVAGYELRERLEEFKSPKGECVHLCLPARFEAQRRCTTFVDGKLFFKDPRTKEGELLWPERFPDKALRTLERKLGEYGTAGQLQQRPAPAGGGILKARWFNLWPKRRALPRFTSVIQSYDTAFTDKTANDPTACTVWGVFEHKQAQHVMLLHAWTKRLEYTDLRKAVKDEFFEARYGEEDEAARATLILIEDKGSGISLQQDLRRARLPVVTYNPGRADKSARAQLAAPYIESGMFYVPESVKYPDEPVVWARPFMEQIGTFPNAEHDDYVDTLTQLVLWLRDSNVITLDREEEDEVPESDDGRTRSNPYGEL